MEHKLTDQEIEWVGDYVMDMLSEEERLDFEQEMSKRPVLEAEVNLQRQVMVLVESVEDTRWKEILQKEQQLMDRKYPKQQKSARPIVVQKKSSYKWAIIIGLILLSLIAFIIWQSNQPPNSKKVYATYFEAYENVLVPTVRNADVPAEVFEAFRYYDAGNYEAALLAFEKLPDSEQEVDYQLYEAIALLKKNEVDKAIPLLQNLAKNPDSQFQEHASWYLALAYLKKEDLPQSVQILQNLLQEQPVVFGDKAAELLEKIQAK